MRHPNALTLNHCHNTMVCRYPHKAANSIGLVCLLFGLEVRSGATSRALALAYIGGGPARRLLAPHGSGACRFGKRDAVAVFFCLVLTATLLV
jgi:hypothetical protein